MEIWNRIEAEMLALYDEEQARHLMRFFKCATGEYGEGDNFLGIRVPTTRSIVRCYRKECSLTDALKLTESPWHEIRLAGFLLMIEVFKRTKGEERRHVVDVYLSVIERGNNWDLVDVISPHLLGEWLLEHPEEISILFQLADMEESLWHQRVAIVTNWMLIRKGVTYPSLRLAEKFLTHTHDLIHKASGWMLREVGKRDLPALLTFLDTHAPQMPRTMLRYAIEKLDRPTRHHYLKMKP